MIKLRDLLNEEFTAVSNKSGKTVVFKNKDSRDAAVKAGTHEVPEDEKGSKDEPKGDKPNMFSKDAGYDAPDTYDDYDDYDDDYYDDEEEDNTPSKLSSEDETEFENALESDGFSWFDGGSLEGTSTFGDDNGNTVSVAPGSVYDSESAFVVSGYNEDDPVNVESAEFDSKEEALAYAKELAQKLKSSNEGTIKLMNLLRK
jgi:hypothetical protein